MTKQTTIVVTGSLRVNLIMAAELLRILTDFESGLGLNNGAFPI